MRLGLTASLVGVCVGGTLAVSERIFGAVLATCVSAAFLLVIWTVLRAKIPQRITIHGPVIEVRRDGHVDSFDLEDPASRSG